MGRVVARAHVTYLWESKSNDPDTKRRKTERSVCKYTVQSLWDTIVCFHSPNFDTDTYACTFLECFWRKLSNLNALLLGHLVCRSLFEVLQNAKVLLVSGSCLFTLVRSMGELKASGLHELETTCRLSDRVVQRSHGCQILHHCNFWITRL